VRHILQWIFEGYENVMKSPKFVIFVNYGFIMFYGTDRRPTLYYLL
jgi:hypothetical protein